MPCLLPFTPQRILDERSRMIIRDCTIRHPTIHAVRLKRTGTPVVNSTFTRNRFGHS